MEWMYAKKNHLIENTCNKHTIYLAYFTCGWNMMHNIHTIHTHQLEYMKDSIKLFTRDKAHYHTHTLTNSRYSWQTYNVYKLIPSNNVSR